MIPVAESLRVARGHRSCREAPRPSARGRLISGKSERLCLGTPSEVGYNPRTLPSPAGCPVIARKVLLPTLVVLCLGGYYAYRQWLAGPAELTASGVLEARNIGVGSKVGGRISAIRVREGDHVEAGQILVEFEDGEQAARVEQARGRLQQARANLEKLENGSRPEDIAESRAAVRFDGNKPGFRRQELESARADLARAKADAANAERELRRYQDLLARSVASRQQYDDARTRRDMANAQVVSLQHSFDAAAGRLAAAEAVLDRARNGFRREDVEAARADVATAEGQVHEAEVLWNEHRVTAPAAATVEVLDQRPGQLLQPTAIVAKLLEDAQLFVMVYVPEPRIGQVRLGQKVEVRLDSFPDRAIEATVEQIRQQAEFLPRNVQTLEERVHQVIGVKLRIDNADHRLRAGVHAEVRFLPPPA
ncbi:MAG: HlyD family efflux transporter periplasmic adaptor subunit [Methylococcaceae bacterium]|nr:HlyD family efflux transporter periplasmic adaptor subunit [Methylococcaceae bacterium]